MYNGPKYELVHFAFIFHTIHSKFLPDLNKMLAIIVKEDRKVPRCLKKQANKENLK